MGDINAARRQLLTSADSGRHADGPENTQRHSGASTATAAGRWDPTVCGSVLLAAAGLALAGLWFVTSAVVQAPERPSCIRYLPNECFFRTDASRPFQSPPCTPEPCSFRIKGMACSDFFAANGNFVREARADGAECEDPFMEGVRRPLMPPCSVACCDGALPGGFVPSGSGLDGAQEWQARHPRARGDARNDSQSHCSYFQYTAAEVLHFLQSNRVRVLVMGDSLQKQLHGRLMHMFRGSRRPIDMRIFAMSRYVLCRGGDSLTVAPGGYDKTIKAIRPQPTLDLIPKFYGAPLEVTKCEAADPPVVFDSFYSGWYEWQIKHVQAYLDSLGDERLILIVGINYIDRAKTVPEEWLQQLDRVCSRKGTKLIVMGTPTGLNSDPELIANWKARNGQLRRWTSDRNVSFVDYDALSIDAHRPSNCHKDIHWMCFVTWGGRGKAEVRVPAADENVLRDRRFGVPVSSVWTTKDGQCYDEMNRNLWQVMFNVFMKWRPD